MNVLKLDVFLQPTRKVELGGKTYNVKPISLRDRMSIANGSFSENEDEIPFHLIKIYIPDFPLEEADNLPPLALNALVRFILQMEDEEEKN